MASANGNRLRIAFLLQSLGRSGGVGIILGHVSRLQAHDVDVDVVLTSSDPGTEIPDLPGVEVLPQSAAADRAYDVAIGTWWETADALFEVPAKRRALFLQGLEQFYYRDDAPFEQLAAALPLLLPIQYVAVSEALAESLAALHPGAPCQVVRNGVDKAVFRPREADARPPGSPLRVLIDGQPGLWFKGTEDAIAAVAGMRQPATVTLVAPDPGAGQAQGLPVTRFVGNMDPAGMADLYAQHDVVLKLSRLEGLGMVPIEAFHVGVPAILTPYGGAGDYLIDGENGVQVEFDDLPATTAWLDRLAVDGDLLAQLSRGALATADAWPSVEASTAALADALRVVATADAPDPDVALAQLMRTVRLRVEIGRQRLVNLQWEVDGLEQAHKQLQDNPAVKLGRLARKALDRS